MTHDRPLVSIGAYVAFDDTVAEIRARGVGDFAPLAARVWRAIALEPVGISIAIRPTGSSNC